MINDLKAFLVEAPEWAREIFPLKIPGWTRHVGHPVFGDFFYVRDGTATSRNDLLQVMCSARVEADGKRWLHVSCARPKRLPTWNDLTVVRDTFIGKDRKAIQVLAPADEHVNIHPYVLHLWSCLDEDPLPDFRAAGVI